MPMDGETALTMLSAVVDARLMVTPPVPELVALSPYWPVKVWAPAPVSSMVTRPPWPKASTASPVEVMVALAWTVIAPVSPLEVSAWTPAPVGTFVPPMAPPTAITMAPEPVPVPWASMP